MVLLMFAGGDAKASVLKLRVILQNTRSPFIPTMDIIFVISHLNWITIKTEMEKIQIVGFCHTWQISLV